MKLETISWLAGTGVIVGSILIENISKNFKPWTIIFKWLGKTINADMMEKLDGLDKRIGKLESSDEKQDAYRQEDKARAARRRIILFADEIRRGVPHSEEAFDNILEDTTFYKNHCRTHPDFQNEKAVRSISSIEEIYDKCSRENSFL